VHIKHSIGLESLGLDLVGFVLDESPSDFGLALFFVFELN